MKRKKEMDSDFILPLNVSIWSSVMVILSLYCQLLTHANASMATMQMYMIEICSVTFHFTSIKPSQVE